MSKYLPVTPNEIADARHRRRRGRRTAPLHLHARDPNDGRPTLRIPEVFKLFLPPHQAVDRRDHQHHHRRFAADDGRGATCAPAATFKPEVASLNMGTINFGLFPMLGALQGVQARLGAALLLERLARTASSRTPSPTSSTILDELRRATARAFEFECYDVGAPLQRSRTSSIAD